MNKIWDIVLNDEMETAQELINFLNEIDLYVQGLY